MPEPLFLARLSALKSQTRERKVYRQDRERRILARVEAEEEENQHQLDSLLATRTDLDRGDVHRMVIPAGRRNAVPLSSARVETYREHLLAVAAEAENYLSVADVSEDRNLRSAAMCVQHEEAFSPDSRVQKISDHICGTCRGACCSSGGETAYLSPLSVRKASALYPDLDKDGIIELYLSRVAPVTIENACINQTPDGCSLPRELRSDICNAYFCDPLLEYHRESAEQSPKPAVLAIQREATFGGTLDPDASNAILDVVLVTEDGVERA
ncbi:hypothetical protein [Microbulbifer elongatus]|uniref:hypothetical protein n=1 Tax=Microbulbifer elongatus TaxID=86173 RepID=UPI001E54A2AA|nr:hypothetical protein [Microbulbifer elongatus]